MFPSDAPSGGRNPAHRSDQTVTTCPKTQGVRLAAMAVTILRKRSLQRRMKAGYTVPSRRAVPVVGGEGGRRRSVVDSYSTACLIVIAAVPPTPVHHTDRTHTRYNAQYFYFIAKKSTRHRDPSRTQVNDHCLRYAQSQVPPPPPPTPVVAIVVAFGPYRTFRAYVRSDSWWNLVNWEYASEQYDAAVAGNKATRRGARRGQRHDDRRNKNHNGR